MSVWKTVCFLVWKIKWKISKFSTSTQQKKNCFQAKHMSWTWFINWETRLANEIISLGSGKVQLKWQTDQILFNQNQNIPFNLCHTHFEIDWAKSIEFHFSFGFSCPKAHIKDRLKLHCTLCLPSARSCLFANIKIIASRISLSLIILCNSVRASSIRSRSAQSTTNIRPCVPVYTSRQQW